MTSPRDPARLRRGLNPLTTSSLGVGGVYTPQLSSTPMSAVSMTSAHYMSAHTAAHTPASAIQPYNPQQWVASPAVGLERPHQFAEAQVSPPPPPPPYSPPRSQHQRPMSGVFEQIPVTTPTPPPRISTTVHRPSPEPANTSFPPPPGTRGGSRERRFGLPSLRRRAEPEPSTSPPDPPPVPRTRQTVGVSTFYSPTPERVESFQTPVTPVIPPAARRAASTGAIETPTSARSRSGSQTRWNHNVPLPPPPPGPPPASSRSQSVQGMDRSNVLILSPPTRRPPPSGMSALGPVPPTPADWIDSDTPPSGRGRSPGLTIDTSSVASSSQPVESLPSSSSASAGGLNRARAVRHDKTIIQRRSESRTRHGTRDSIDERTQPKQISDIVVPEASSNYTRTSQGKSTPRSGQVNSAGLQDSRNSTPKGPGSAKLPQLEAETPPFSPFPVRPVQHHASSSTVAPKALPTPPPNVRSASSSRPRDGSRPPPSGPVSKHLIVTQSAEQFAAATIERFQAFASSETAATSDQDRIRLFADFIVNESRIRRERYSGAIGAMGSEIFDLTRDLFRPMVVPARRESNASQDEWTPGSESARSHRGSFGSVTRGEGSSSAPGSAGLSPSTTGGSANNGTYTNNFMPSLSPILSMSVSDNYENGSSRGRPPSRWWETDSNGEPSGLERSKRESKYMGVPKDQWIEEDVQTASTNRSSSEYPPEKTGWHDQADINLTPQPHRFSNSFVPSSTSSTPIDRAHLDVSRLVTMPPPYPRHHPAVNNSHPELSSIRASVRVLSDLSEVKATKEKFAAESAKRREKFAQEASQRRQELRGNLQQEINSGNISYADAGAIESDSQANEHSQKKELEKSEYEKFQNEVVLPLNELLTARITQATGLLDDLGRHLFDNGQNDADMPQEEGDDRPELLEKLTLMKWIFEARESLHRVNYDILTDRNTRYCEVVITPYRLSGNAEKLKSAEAFFAEDSAKREYAFANEVLDRTRDFRTVVDDVVQRGVTLQLSAFWDIAPPLCGLLDNIPSNLSGFNIQIPASEFDENPQYLEHPMQYLFSLLLHSEKSTYQFIEAHTNLVCLLHEVKEAVVHAKAKVLETQTADADGRPVSGDERKERAQSMREVEEKRLTQDLKEKVREVQDQWNSALGEGIKLVKERLGEWLLQTGGWDESLEERGVGSV